MGSAFEIGFVFNMYTLGENCLERLGFKPEQYNDFGWSLLEALGYTEEQIEEANTYVCGTMTVEGAPHLKDEHLPVFDCANKCGQIGERLSMLTAHPHDGGCTAFPERCHQQNHQPAERSNHRGDRRLLPPQLGTRIKSVCALP